MAIVGTIIKIIKAIIDIFAKEFKRIEYLKFSGHYTNRDGGFALC